MARQGILEKLAEGPPDSRADRPMLWLDARSRIFTWSEHRGSAWPVEVSIGAGKSAS
jgi:hypothetical protein